MQVTMHSEDHIGYVTLSNPPVNAIGQAVRQGLLEAVRWAERNRLDRVIVCGAGGVFAAGADAKEFDAPPLEPHLPEVLNAIDESFVPWIAAIEGVALGGGAEIAMACRMRIMAPGARIGLPEVTLGVIPGAGGTARLPRLVGLQKAVEMITMGKPIGPQEACSAGLIHAVEEHPIEAAFLVNSEALGCIVPTWEYHAPALDPELVHMARKKLQAKMAGQEAPLRALEVIEAGLSLPFHDALAQERRVFLQLKTGLQAKALRHIFFAQRAAKAPAPFKGSAVSEVQHAVVVGGGNSAGQAAMYLSRTATCVHIVVRGDSLAASMSNYLTQRLEADPAIQIHYDTEITDLHGEGHLEGVTFTTPQGDRVIDTRALFVMIGAAPNTGWLSGLVETDDRGFVKTGAQVGRETPYETATDGVFAVGDVRSGSVKRVASAVGEGSVVVSRIWSYLDRLAVPASTV